MIANPLVSILMPVKNAAPWLDECVFSIRNQSLNSWELLAVDDGSSDESMQKLRSHAHQDKRIRVYSSRGNGISPALQTALQLSRGSFISRMDADDRMPVRKLESFVAAAKKRGSSVVTGKVQYFSEEQRVSPGYLQYQQWLNDRTAKEDHREWIYRECPVAGANWLCHRSLLPPRLDHLDYPEDYDLVFYWLRKGIHIHGLDAVTHEWREHPMRTSRHHEHYAQRSFFKLKLKRFLEIDRDKERPLVLLGGNSKSKLSARVFHSLGEPFETVNLTNSDRLASIDRPQVLVAVYPSPTERKQLITWLGSHGLTMGKEWWWL